MLPLILSAVASALIQPAKDAVTGAANKALAAGVTAGVLTYQSPDLLAAVSSIGFFAGWSPETVHHVATLASFVIGFLVTYVLPNAKPPEP